MWQNDVTVESLDGRNNAGSLLYRSTSHKKWSATERTQLFNSKLLPSLHVQPATTTDIYSPPGSFSSLVGRSSRLGWNRPHKLGPGPSCPWSEGDTSLSVRLHWCFGWKGAFELTSLSLPSPQHCSGGVGGWALSQQREPTFSWECALL